MNSTKLSLFCDKVLEMGWLLAVIITPLLFNVYSSRVFEPDKLTTLRTVALIMAAVWIVKYIEERTHGKYDPGFTWRTPLVLPTLLTTVIYVLSTILSVTPRVSLFGSYQRLQGTYTTLAYIVVFLIILQGMRTREQLDRLITVVIINSLPIALYGLIQHNKLDPLPWGGDVTRRVASNMGNAIFVAAYLIMAVFPTLSRIVAAFRSILHDEDSGAADVFRAAAYIFIFLVQVIAIWYTKSRGPMVGLLAGIGIWSFLGILSIQRAAIRERPVTPATLPKDLGRGVLFGLGSLGAAVVVGGLLYQIGKMIAGADSSVPEGLAAGGLLLTFVGVWLGFIVNRQGWRWMWSSTLVLAIIASAGFLVINLPGPIHEMVLNTSADRLARVLQYQGGTGMVRNLIWQGALKLILPHDPLQYPPTEEYPQGHRDPFNVLRPVIGYGPESMYVAYNPFYPPLLGHYESRTASPDRSHNETMDSLVITGLLGFIVYLWIFGGVFYYGLHWLGFVPSDWRRMLLFILMAVGAVVAMAIVIPTIGPHFFCIAIPIGIVGGMFIYLVVYSISVYWDPEVAAEHHSYYTFILIGILSAIVAHYVEINFGIAIASTRTTFWAYAGLLVVSGTGLIKNWEPTAVEPRPSQPDQATEGGRRRKRRRKTAPAAQQPQQQGIPAWLWTVFMLAAIGGFVLGTLSFDFVTNAERLAQPVKVIWRALTVLPAQESRTSYGALMIFALTWLMSAVIFLSEMAKRGQFRERKGDSLLAAVVYLIVSLTVGFGFALVLASSQTALVKFQAQSLEDIIYSADKVAGFLTAYYWFIVVVLAGGGAMLFLRVRRRPQQESSPWSIVAAVVLAVLVGATAVLTNLTPIKADIVYKQADPYDRGKQWVIAIELYKHAIELAPKEDFYYLYLGRAYLEYASSLKDTTTREAVMKETERTLLKARDINPLNTDHSANLARMYRRWADFATDSDQRLALLRKSSENYEIATTLSPQNAILWNEWAMLYYYGLHDKAGFSRAITRSLELDDEFDQTWLVLGDVSRQEGDLEKAAACYETALQLKPKAPQVWRMLGDTYIALQEWDKAIAALNKAVELQPRAKDIWNIHQVLARLYSQQEEYDKALAEAQMALEKAPDDQKDSVQQLVNQLQALNSGQQ